MSMRLFGQVLGSEVRKLKRTLALYMVVIAPFVICALYCAVGLASPAGLARPGRDVWLSLIQNSVTLWTVMMLPLFVTLETSLLAGLEHTERNWKFVLTMPMPRWMVYAAKLVVVIGLVWLAQGVLAAGTLANGIILRTFAPNLGIGSLAVEPLLTPLVKVSAALLLGLTIQHWVSIRFSSFTVAMGFGMAAMVVGFVVVNSTTYGPWYPWSLALHAVSPRPDVINPMWVSVSGAAVAAVVGAWDFSRRDVV